MYANIYFVKNTKTQHVCVCVCIKQKHDFCIFERLDHTQKNIFFMYYYYFCIYLFIYIFAKPCLAKKPNFLEINLPKTSIRGVCQTLP